MDNSMRNIGDDDTSDKVTIKVKVSDEEYHDLVIDWSDRSGPHKGQQVIHQLSSITGFPSRSIEYVFIRFTTYDYFTIGNAKIHFLLGDYDFTKENCSARINDGDCFAISTKLMFGEDDFDPFDRIDNWVNYSVRIYLCSRVMFTDNDCSPDYCHHVNTRAFLNRKVAIVTNTWLIRKLKSELPFPGPEAGRQAYEEYHLQRTLIYQDLGINPFIRQQLCHLSNRQYYELTPDYARTRG